jgi:flavodoxin
MKKRSKIILALFAVLIFGVATLGAIVFFDLAAYTSTGSETLTPSGTSVGKALVVYDLGLSGTSKDVASKISSELQAHGYTVTFAGIKSGAATNTSGYDIIVAGGPIYAGTPTSSVKDFLTNLSPAQGVKLGVFGSGSGAQEQSDIDQITNALAGLSNGSSLADAVVVKIGSGEDLNARSADFVAQLLG